MTPDDIYIRKVQTSVTCFLYCGDEYLFLKRKPTKRIDPNKLNGIGGRVEPKEDYLAAAIRETEEETGYVVKPEDCQLCTIGKIEGGYEEDWVMCFFRIQVPHKVIPLGTETEDGTLMWIHKDKVFDTEHELLDDLNYVFKDMIQGDNIVFFNAQVNKQEKIETINLSKLSL